MCSIATSNSLDIGCTRLTRFAVVCLWIGIAAGIAGAMFYTPAYSVLNQVGVTPQWLRPLHLIAGTGWIYLAGIAVVVHFWSKAPSEARRDAKRSRAVRFLLLTWALGALVVLITLLLHRYGGREYFFISVPASVLFWSGWVPLAWVFLRSRDEPLSRQPVYVWMWMTSFGLFTYSFVETHVFLLPYFQSHPLRDMAVEWKSYGTLVGSFNLLMYGSLSYLSERMNPTSNYSRSRLAFALFSVGVLNSFTNYGHHTYHLPQSMIVKWTSFSISMTEALILAKVVWDMTDWAARFRRERRWDGVTWLLASTAAWTLFSLVLAIAISIPPLNSLIHGTFVVAAHAMGSMLGIDTLALLAVLSWIHMCNRGERAAPPRWAILALNCGILALWSSFLAIGIGDSFRRWEAGILPSMSLWSGVFGTAFVGGGMLVAVGIVVLTAPWVFAGSRVAPPRSAAMPSRPPVAASSAQGSLSPGMRQYLARNGMTVGDLGVFASIASLMVALGVVVCIAARTQSPDAWTWGVRLLSPWVSIGITALLVTGCVAMKLAMRQARGTQLHRIPLAIAVIAAFSVLAILAGDVDRLRAHGLLPGAAFRPHPRFVARVLGVAQPEDDWIADSLPQAPPAIARGLNADGGRRLFLATCASCHGPLGDGVSGQGTSLLDSLLPADEGEFVRFVSVGRAATDPKSSTKRTMPARGGNTLLSEADLKDIAYYVQYLRERASGTAKRIPPDLEALATNERTQLAGSFIPRSTLPDPPVGPRGLNPEFLAMQSRPRWKPPAHAHTYFAVYLTSIGLLGGSVALAGVASFALAIRSKGAAIGAPLNLVTLWWWGVSAGWVVMLPLFCL